jgi:hypothetical protein
LATQVGLAYKNRQFYVNITVHRNGRNFGPYTINQVNAYLASGRLSPSDRAWYEGSAQWVLLSSIQGVNVPPPAPPPVDSKRSVVKLVLLAILWIFVFWLGWLFLGGARLPYIAEQLAVAGSELSPPGTALETLPWTKEWAQKGFAELRAGADLLQHHTEGPAGRQARESLDGLFFLIAVGLSVWLTVAGKLPGTKATL